MRTIYYSIVLALLLPVLGFSGNDFNGRHTKQKKIQKSYSVSSGALLAIDNSYGSVDITTWDQNRIEIEVIIKTNGNDEEKVIQRLSEIDVDFEGSQSYVSAKTRLEKQNSSWWSNLFGSSSNVNIEINYRVKAPVKNNLELSNDYGSVSLDKLEGNATISIDYGSFSIGELLGDRNLIAFDYTRNSTIDYIRSGKIVADYSDFSITEAGTLQIVADYTTSKVQKVENISFDCDYGSIKIDKLRNIKGNGDYLNTDLGDIYNSLDLNLDYGSASIDRLMKSVQEVSINSDYTGIKIGYDNKNPFRFNITTSYGNVKGLEGPNFELNKRHQSNTSNHFEGYFIENSGGQVSINSSYGNISFNN